ncbi:MAG: endonuclease/exonuclease/phosphatase family protein [Candidatus Nanohaloarchaea archaeon]
MRVLSFNTGYFLGYSGKHLDYLKRPQKSILPPSKEDDNFQLFFSLVDRTEPDIVLLQEVDGGSIRTSTDGQDQYISHKLNGYQGGFANKYRGSIFSSLPMLRYMGNMVLYREGEYREHRLSIGRKNLVQEIELEGLSVFSLHLSTIGGWIRKRQMKEFRDILDDRDRFVVAGDMNLHKGREEQLKIEKILGRPINSPGKTFPSSAPAKELDLVVNSENLKINRLKKHDSHFSDHKPVSFEVDHRI